MMLVDPAHGIGMYVSTLMTFAESFRRIRRWYSLRRSKIGGFRQLGLVVGRWNVEGGLSKGQVSRPSVAGWGLRPPRVPR